MAASARPIPSLRNRVMVSTSLPLDVLSHRSSMLARIPRLPTCTILSTWDSSPIFSIGLPLPYSAPWMNSR
jgi:hypothetical protein